MAWGLGGMGGKTIRELSNGGNDEESLEVKRVVAEEQGVASRRPLTTASRQSLQPNDRLLLVPDGEAAPRVDDGEVIVLARPRHGGDVSGT